MIMFVVIVIVVSTATYYVLVNVIALSFHHDAYLAVLSNLSQLFVYFPRDGYGHVSLLLLLFSPMMLLISMNIRFGPTLVLVPFRA